MKKSFNLLHQKRLVLIGIILTALALNPILVFATSYYTYNDHKITGGVTSRSYYIDSSASTWTIDIDFSASSWTNTSSRLGISTPISYYKTSVKSNSVMDIYGAYDSTYPGCGMNAWTEFWITGTEADPDSYDWKYNKIYLNTYTSAFAYTNTTTLKGIIGHEMGHCFGLDDNNTRTDIIMCQSGYGRSVYESQSCDLAGINYLY